MKKVLSLMVLVLSLLICSCTDENDISHISLSEALIEIDASSGSTSINIKANCPWTASADVSWLKVTPAKGTGDAVLNCEWTANTEPQQRTATITVQSGDVIKTTRVVQSFSIQPQVVSCRGVIGNLMKNEESYFEITFDQPVSAESVDLDRYSPSSGPKYSNNSKTIHYDFKSARLGQDLACKVRVRNDSGIAYNYDVNIPFYQKKFLVEGGLMYALLSEDKQSVWVTTAEPSRLIQLSLDDGHVMHNIELSFVPRHICYNPYNKKIYVLPVNANYEYNNFLCVVDPVSGRIDETITFDPAPDAHPQHPTIYPYDLQFTNDGFGIVLLRARAASNLEWRYIDGANNNQLSLSGYRWYEKIFEELYRSYDGNKIWANKYPADYTTIYSVSRNEPIPKEYAIHGKFRSDEFYAGGRLVDMQFSPFGNKVFISAAPRSVCVVDLDTDTYSVVIMGDARDSKAAWDCTSSSRSLVYHVCGFNHMFLLLDMERGEPIFYNYHIWSDYYNKPCNVYHLPASDQLMITAWNGIYLFDASVMKKERP